MDPSVGMNRRAISNTYTCPECDHDHDVVVVRGEYPEDDYAEFPECCEACGEVFDHVDSVDAERKAERRQMGITE